MFIRRRALVLIAVLFLLVAGGSLFKLGASTPRPVPVKGKDIEVSISPGQVAPLAVGSAECKGCGSAIVSSYASVYESQVFETDFPFNALGLQWEENLPDGASVQFQVRYRAEAGSWSTWEEVIGDDEGAKDGPQKQNHHVGELVGTGWADAFQYRVIFSFSDKNPLLSQKLIKVKATYIDSKTGVEDTVGFLENIVLGLKRLFRSDGGRVLAHSPSKSPSVINRSGWGADESLRYEAGEEIWTPAYANIQKVIVHHTVFNNSNPKVAIRAIYYYHAVTLDWGDIGYNFIIDKNGNIYEGRYGGDGVVAGHARRYNTGSVGVAVLGNFECSSPHPCDPLNNRIKNALHKVAVWKLTKHGVDPTVNSYFVDKTLPAIIGHYEVGTTQCPGTNIKHDISALRSRARFMPQEVLVKFKSGVSSSQISSLASKYSLTQLSLHQGNIRRFAIPIYRLTGEINAALRKEGIVQYAVVNRIYLSAFTPNDLKFPDQWNLSNIKVPQAWDVTPGGSSSVAVAVLDTGIAYESYSDSKGTYAKATDFTATNFASGYDFVNRDSHPNDDHGHGTAVASVIASTTNNTAGIAGIAYSASIMPVKVLDENGAGTDATVSDGIRFAASNGAKVLNLSFGSSNSSPIIENAVSYARVRGVSLVATAGNQGREGLVYPAKYRDVIAIGASDLNDNRTSYSNYGSRLDVLAPGGDLGADLDNNGTKDGILFETLNITSAGDFTNFEFALGEGTSYATAHASAVLTMMRSVAGNVGAIEFKNALVNNASAKGVIDAFSSVNNPPAETVPLGVIKLDPKPGRLDPNFYLHNAPAGVEKRGVIAADYWAISDHNVVAISGFKDGNNKRIGVIRYTDKPRRRDYNFYLYALSESGVQKSTLVGANYWSIADGGIPIDVAGVDVDGDGVDEVAVLKKKKKSWGWDYNLYVYRLPNGVENTPEVGADYWNIPDGGAYLITGVGDIDGDGKGDIGVIKAQKKPRRIDHNFFVFRAPIGVQHSKQIGANYWDLPDRGVNVDMSGVGDLNADGKNDLAIMKRIRKSWGWDYNLYVYPIPTTVATNEPYFAADYWRIPSGNRVKFISGIIK